MSHKATENLNRPVMSTEMETLIKSSKKKNKQTNISQQKIKVQDQVASKVNFIKHLEKS